MLPTYKNERLKNCGSGYRNWSRCEMKDAEKERGLKNIQFLGPSNSLLTVVNIELAVDVFEMSIDGMR